MAEKVAYAYKQRISRVALAPSSGGVFEVRVNGRVFHSKAATGEFPDEEAIVAEIGKLLPAT